MMSGRNSSVIKVITTRAEEITHSTETEMPRLNVICCIDWDSDRKH